MVRQLYSLCLAGNGPTKIARMLTEQQIPTPRTLDYMRAGNTNHYYPDYPCIWATNTICHILERREDTGCHVNFKATMNPIRYIRLSTTTRKIERYLRTPTSLSLTGIYGNGLGKITDARFMELSQDYEDEQAELKKRLATMQTEQEQAKAASEGVEKFMTVVQRYMNFEELTHTLLREFVAKIVVHEAEETADRHLLQFYRQG